MNAFEGRRGVAVLLTILVTLVSFSARSVIPNPGDPPDWLNYWSFFDTNTWQSVRGYYPLHFTNLDSSMIGNGHAVVVDNTNGAILRYNVIESSGTNNLKVDRGSVMMWFAPSWSGTNAGGDGPGQWGRLVEVGVYTTNSSYGWWSLYTDPAGVNLYFAAQTNGAQALYLAAPIAWTTNRWHLIALTYSATNATLYLDGQIATNAPYGMSYWPGPDVLTNGFCFGSDSTGAAQARGMFDEISTYDHPLEPEAISGTYDFFWFSFYLNPENFANLITGGSSDPPITGPTFVAIHGNGRVTQISSNWFGCTESTNIWMTNAMAWVTNGTNMDMKFEIRGGSNGVRYDIFANSICAPASNPTNRWVWMGQGYHCATYLLTNLPIGAAAYVVLGKPTDSDFDGLTDAYENLVSKTDPSNPDSDGDGVIDGWEVVFGLDPKKRDTDDDGIMDEPFAISISRPKTNSQIP